MTNQYVDCDGHVMERVDEIAERIGKVNGIEGEINPRRMVPSLDRFHTPRFTGARRELSIRVESGRRSGSSF